MLATRHAYLKQCLSALAGLIGMTGMTPNAPAQCQLQKLTPFDGAAFDVFGAAVAISGDTAVIGAPFDDDLGSDSGSAYVYEKVSGVWTQMAKLNAGNGAAGDQFGGSVAISGNTAVIGARVGDGQEVNSGAAYVFEKVSGVWTQTAKLSASDGVSGDRFGSSVAVSGDRALVGDPEADVAGSPVGAAYLFSKSSGVWSGGVKFFAADRTAGSQFGGSVAISGDTAVIGARFAVNAFSSITGAAYVFEKVSGWTQTAKLDTAARGNEFGGSVALSGFTAVIGAQLDNAFENNSGAAYVFEKAGGAWTQAAWLKAADAADSDFFGGSVAVAGATAVIGALGDDALGSNSGSAYVFEKGWNGVWGNVSVDQFAKLNAADGAAYDEFGGSVAVSGATVLIGAPFDNDLGNDSGSAYVFVMSGDDCNNNSIPDACDIAGGTSADCNGGGVPDECDVDPADPDGNGLVSADCNANGIPDECDLVSETDFVHQSGEFSPFQFFADAAEVIPALPPADGDVTLTVEVKADLDQGSEFVDVFLNGMPAGRLFESGGVQCPATFDTGSLVIPEATFNALLPGEVTVKLVPSAEVGACTGVTKLRLSYAAESNDCNANGIPDDCDTDSDGDGVIDDCDSCPLDNPDDIDGDGVCDADDLCAGTPLGLLVDLDGCTLAEGPCCFFGGVVCIGGTDRRTCEAFPDGVFQGEGLTCGDPDADGVFGCADGCPLDPAKADPGVCGCGAADDDEDLDGIADCNDRCSQTPFGLPVNVCGCAEVGACCATGGGCFDGTERTVCVTIAGVYQGDGSTCADGCSFGDRDGDGDVDLGDVGAFQRCFTGEGGEVAAECLPFDVDGCGSIDLDDFAALMDALTGPTGGPPPPDPVCGNGLIEPGEACDDGNTVPGDGCDENCELEPGFCGDGFLDLLIEQCDDGNNLPGDGCDANCMIERPANDDCAKAIAAFDGDNAFNNISATTDGPDEPGICDFGVGTTQVADDIWYCYQATCNGTVVASLCGSDYDTKLAVYDGCTCPPTGQPLACSDDDCGAGAFDSRLTFSAVQGQSYAIRVGGFDNGSQGTGTLALRCDAQPLCDVAAGDCFAAGGNGSPGCDTASCCDTTCAADPFCCDVTWDATCAAEAQGLCTGSFPACTTSTGACDADNGRAGCADESCCNLVCAVDPFCCVDTWDDFCASEAAGICGLNCGTTGAPRNNACDTIAVPGVNTPVAGCSDETTCRNVCTTAPECCFQAWDQRCVCLANPSDPCCVAVCAPDEDPFCCTTEWDDLCDQSAADLCTP